jgi:hypothetical protein
MAVSNRQKTAFVVVIGYLFAIFAKTLLAIYRLNVEEWAKEKGYDQLYKVFANPPEWLIAGWDFLVNPFGQGFVLGALIFGLWEYGPRFFSRSSAKGRLEDLHAKGVVQRDELLPIKENYDDAGERRTLDEWSDRVVQQVRRAGVSRADCSRFESLGAFEAKHDPLGDPNRDGLQIALELTWNEKLRRLREIIDALK